MSEEITAIKILHNSNNRIIFNLYAELFRLFGIYVGEGTIRDYSIDEANRDLQEFQLFLGIYDKQVQEFSGFEYIKKQYIWINSQAEVYKNISLEAHKLDHEEKKKVKNEITRVLAELLNGKGETFYRLLVSDGCLDIYLNQNILKGACQLQFYRLKSKINNVPEGIFTKATNEFENLINKRQIMECEKNLLYALLYCKQKTNLSLFYQPDKTEKYCIEDLKGKCEELITRFPEFSNSYVLMGMICENYESTKLDAVNAYRAAIDKISDKSYSSHVYYWLGVLCENYLNNLPVAESFYQQSVKLKIKYRNLYKVGSMLYKRKELNGAIEIFEKCLQLIENQKRHGLDPLEMEYYYKTSALICMISVFDLKNFAAGIKYGKLASDFYDIYLENDKAGLFKYYFRDNAEKYREESKKRINTERVYTALAIGYREMGDVEKAEEYFNKNNSKV